MANLIKYAIIYNFDRNKKLLKNGTASILIRAYLNSKYRYFSTGIYIAPTQWDKHTSRIIKHPKQHILNSFVRKEIDRIETYEFELRRRGEVVTLDYLDNYTDTLAESFTGFYWEQLEQSILKRESYTDQRQTLYKLKEYRSVILFNDLNFKLVSGFNAFLFRKGLKTNTVAKHHKNLKKYINLAINLDFLDANRHPYRNFRVAKEPTERIYLTESELKQLENLSFSKEKEHLDIIKDFFLFCCYTGLRFSDVAKITDENLSITDDGIFLGIKAKKTKKPWHYNLRKFFRAADGGESRPELIIKKRLAFHNQNYGSHPMYEDELLFLGLTNPYINRKLKEIAKMMNVRQVVKDRISTHSGRHTFGTIMAGKIKVVALQKLLQHSKLKETMIYVDIRQNMVDDELDNVDW